MPAIACSSGRLSTIRVSHESARSSGVRHGQTATANKTTVRVVERRPEAAVHRRPWVDAARRARPSTVVDPVDRRGAVRGRRRRARRRQAALDAAVAAQAACAGDQRRASAPTSSPGAFELMHERDRRPRPADDAGDGQAAGRGPGRDRLRRRVPPLVRRGGRAHRRRLRGSPRPAGAPFLVMRQPVGPCLLITPWNFPMAMGTRKIGPGDRRRLHHGLKPAAADPAVDAALAAILAEAGLPDGVLNWSPPSHAGRRDGAADPRRAGPQAVLHRLDRGRPQLCSSSARRRSCAPRWSSGGNAPFIVFDDADLDAAVEGAMRGQDAQHGRGLHRGQPLLRARAR